MARHPKSAALGAEAAAPEIDRTHNNPPEPIAPEWDFDDDGWAAYMDQVFAGVRERLTPMLEVFARFRTNYPLKASLKPNEPPIGIEKWDDDVQGRCATLRERFRDVLKMVDDLHSIEKAPVLRASRVIDGKRNALIGQIGIYDSKKKLVRGAIAPLNVITDRTTIYGEYRAAESQRAAREEAERKQIEAREAAEAAARTMEGPALDRAAEAAEAAEAAAVEANAPVAAHSRVYGDSGGMLSLRTTWQFIENESDLMALVKAVAAGEEKIDYLQFNLTRIGYAVRSDKVRAIEGCVIREVRST